MREVRGLLKITTVLGACFIVLATELLYAAPPEFANAIVPILTKAGCNSGACHGAAIGRGGFRLSLYGQNPENDWQEIARSLGGRRINLTDPESSLLLRKAGEFMEHGGGMRLSPSARDWSTLVQWIQHGAGYDAGTNIRHLETIEATPSRTHLVLKDSRSVSFRVDAVFDDGSRQDITRWAILTPQDPDSARVEPESGKVDILRPGRHVMLARVRDKVATVEILASESAYQDAWPGRLDGRNFIDTQVNRQLRELDLDIGSRALDETLARRLTLDLTGRLPEVDTTNQFIASKQADKIDRLVDQLLASEAMVDYWAHWLANQLRANGLDRRGSPVGRSSAFHAFLKQNIAAETPLPDLLAGIVLSDGTIESNPAVGFYMLANDGREQTELFSELFIGVRMGCANCHNHPLDRWTQDDYHGLAALFAGIRRSPEVTWKPGAINIHPATGDPAVARLPDGSVVGDGQDPRPLLADWVRGEGRTAVARAWVNRIWANLFGTGLVSPEDDLRISNPATHPQLLDQLTDAWNAHDFDLKFLLRTIVLSETYQREPLGTHNDPVSQFALASVDAYGYRRPKRLSPAVLIDALSQATDIWLPVGDHPAGTRAVQTVQPTNESIAAATENGCTGQNCSEDLVDSLTGRLALIVGPMVNDRLANPNGRISKWAADETISDSWLIQRIYQHCFSRQPSDEELAFWLSELSLAHDRNEFVEDIAWSLLTSPRFTMNH